MLHCCHFISLKMDFKTEKCSKWISQLNDALSCNIALGYEYEVGDS